MLKINLIRKQKKNPIWGLIMEPSIWFLIFATAWITACGKSDLGDGTGITAAAAAVAPVASVDFKNQCAWQGGQITVAADGAQVCKYVVGSGGSAGTSGGFSLNFNCSFSSSQQNLATGISVAGGDTIRVMSSKSVGVYIYSGFSTFGYFTVNGAAKQVASHSGGLALSVTIPAGCSSGGLDNLGISSIQVDRCLDTANQPHTCS